MNNISDNAGELLAKTIEEKNIKVEELQNLLSIENAQSIEERIDYFKKKKGWVSTYLTYAEAAGFEINFILEKEEGERFSAENLGELLEDVRKENRLNKQEFAEKKLNLTNYNNTYNAFYSNRCSFPKVHRLFEDTLGYKIKYKMKEKNNL